VLGLSVLALVVVRLCVRWVAGAAPPIEPPMPRWPALLARLMHVALYALMIAAPLLGWLALSTAGKPVNLFGFALPLLTGTNEALAHPLKDLHETLATAGYALIGLHAAAALLHHYVIHDNTFVRMLPGHGSNKKPEKQRIPMKFMHRERHRTEHIGWLRAAVLGANDGIISTASLVVGVAAAQASHASIMTTAVAGLVAGAMSMAAGEYVSVFSQADTEKADLAREHRELTEDPEAEHRELTAIYTRRGIEPSWPVPSHRN
jgi:cytochrome b561